MLTERERMALHWLAEGLSAREIARRLQIGDRTVIEARQEIRGGARSLPPAPSTGTDSAQDKISRPRQSLARLAVTSTVASPLNENPL
jgi:transposase